MKRTIIGLLFGMMAVMAFAVPARRTTISHTQQDGTVLSLTLVGDEMMHYYLNTTTGEAMRQGEDGDYYVIAQQDLTAQAAAAATRRAQANQQRIARLPQLRRAMANGPQRVGTTGTITGSKKGLVILVNFSDKSMQSAHNQAAFDAMFNTEGYSTDGHIGSVSDYFKDQSYGQFNLTFDVVGPVTLSNTMAYYGGNDTSGNDKKPGHMAKQACQAVDASVNFADYDWDGDGYVDQVFIIYAGYGENYSGADENTIWPHEWDLYSAGAGNLSVDGVTVHTYACAAELYGTSGTTLNGMGTAVHEFSHCLGYPDSYDTDYSGGVGMDSYDVMCGGSYNGPNGRGEVPAGYTAYERWCAGWLTPIELTTAATVTNMPALNDEATAYIIKNTANTDEYFMLENRQSREWFGYYDSGTAGHGLFITHIDYDATVWSDNEPNDDASHQRLCWVPADGSYGTYSSSYQSWTVTNSQHKGDFFPGTGSKTTFNGTSHASVGGKWFTAENGSTTFSHAITSITETSGKIGFDFDGGMHDDGTRYTITLDACGGTVSRASWTQTTYQEKWALPEPETSVAGWNGAGWTTQPLTAYTPLAQVDLIDAGTPGYQPASNITLYAVYIDDDADLCHSNPANFTVTLDAGAGTCATTTWTQGAGSRSLSLPTPTIGVEGWSFAGWATASAAETHTAPSFAASPYKPTANTMLYAVYKKSDSATGDDNTFRLASTLTAGNRYVFATGNTAGSAYAITKDNLLDLSSSGRTTTGADITISASLTVSPTDAMIWVCSEASGAFNLTNGSDYLGINGNGIGKRSSGVKMYWDSSYGLYGQNSGGTKSYYAQRSGTTTTINTAQSGSSTSRLYAYEATGAGGTSYTYNSNPQAEEPGGEEPGGEEPGEEPGETPTSNTVIFMLTAHLGQPFEGFTYTTDSDGAKTYSSSDSSVAEVDATTGAVTIKAVGSATITCSVAETDTFDAAAISYKINVVE